MKTFVATESANGRLTIPAEIRREMGIRVPGRIEFVLDESGVRLRPPDLTLEELLGSIPGKVGTSIDFHEEIDAAMFEALRHLGPDGRRE